MTHAYRLVVVFLVVTPRIDRTECLVCSGLYLEEVRNISQMRVEKALLGLWNTIAALLTIHKEKQQIKCQCVIFECN